MNKYEMNDISLFCIILKEFHAYIENDQCKYRVALKR